jgi:hypothetical protein
MAKITFRGMNNLLMNDRWDASRLASMSLPYCSSLANALVPYQQQSFLNQLLRWQYVYLYTTKGLLPETLHTINVRK